MKQRTAVCISLLGLKALIMAILFVLLAAHVTLIMTLLQQTNFRGQGKTLPFRTQRKTKQIESVFLPRSCPLSGEGCCHIKVVENQGGPNGNFDTALNGVYQLVQRLDDTLNTHSFD